VRALELSKNAKDRLAELKALSEEAESRDKGARRALRKAVRESPREIVAEASDLARRGQWALIKTAASGEPLKEEALLARLDLMRSEIAGPDPTPLEVLLVEKIVAVWMVTELLELLNTAQLTAVPKSQRIDHKFLKFYLGWHQQAHRQLLNAIRSLTQVRRLQRSEIPNSQTNVQINLAATNGQSESFAR
jgi:hypothetical protein